MSTPNELDRSKRRRGRRSAPDRSTPRSSHGDGTGSAVFPDVPHCLKNTPEKDGYRAGFELAQKYPDSMMRVMEGYRSGAKRGKELADLRRGQSNE